MESYKLERRLTAGGEAEPWVATDLKSPDTKVVVKIYKPNFEPDETVLEKLKGLNHPDILRLLDYGTTTEGRFYEVSEYAAGGSLEGQKLHEDFLEEVVIREVLEAFRYCHGLKIIHNDIKPANLLFRLPGPKDLVVGDFGFSSLLNSGQSLVMAHWKGFTFTYAAPELLSAKKSEDAEIFGKEVDYYALGMTLDVLLLGEDPFSGLPPGAIYFQKINWNVLLPQDVSPRFQALLRGLLHPMRKSRWGLEELEKWLKKEEVSVADYSPGEATVLFHLGNKVAHNLKEVARLLLENPEEAHDHVADERFDLRIEKFNDSTAIEVRKILKLPLTIENKVAEIVYLLDPILPYRLASDASAKTPGELARLIDRDKKCWDLGKDHVFSGRIGIWLRAKGHAGIWGEWLKNHRPKYESQDNRDEGLECFIHLLDLERKIPFPKLRVKPCPIRLPSVPGGETSSREFSISTVGRGYLAGSVEVRDPTHGITLSQNTFKGPETTLTVSANTANLERGRTYRTSIRINSNTEKTSELVAVRFRVTLPFAKIATNGIGFAALGAAVTSGYRFVIGSTSVGWTPGVRHAVNPQVAVR